MGDDLFDEVIGLGFDRSYPTFTRQLRARGLRPHCEPCHPAKGRPVAVIEHPLGDETQWDWVELPDPPAHWGWAQGVPAGRRAGPFGTVARLAVGVDGPAAPDRGPGPGHPRPRRPYRGVAVRPDGHRRAPGIRPRHRVVRRGGQALRRVRAAVPAAARQPQGRRGEGQPRRGAAVLAHPARRRHARAGPAAPGHLVHPARGRPAARDRGRQGHRGHDRRARAAAPGAAGAVPGHPVGRRAPSRRRHWCPSAATATASHPSSPGPPSSCPAGSAPAASTSPPRPGP